MEQVVAAQLNGTRSITQLGVLIIDHGTQLNGTRSITQLGTLIIDRVPFSYPPINYRWAQLNGTRSIAQLGILIIDHVPFSYPLTAETRPN